MSDGLNDSKDTPRDIAPETPTTPSGDVFCVATYLEAREAHYRGLIAKEGEAARDASARLDVAVKNLDRLAGALGQVRDMREAMDPSSVTVAGESSPA